MKNHKRNIHWILSAAVCGIAFISAAFGETTPPKGKLKVFLLAGQSNMDGRGDGSKLTAEDKGRLAIAQQHIQFAYNRQPVVPLDVTTPKPYTAKKFKLERTFGPELFFGLGVSERWPNERMLFIKRSIGGTSLYGCWNPEWTEEKARVMSEEKKPRLYADFVAYIKEVLADYPSDEIEFCGMLWVQGEADSGVSKFGPKPADSYGQNLQRLIQGVRKEVDVPDLPFMIMQVGNGKVVESMQKAAETLKNVSFISQSKDPKSPAYLPGYGPPVGHYNYEGMKRIGAQFADVFIQEYTSKPDQ